MYKFKKGDKGKTRYGDSYEVVIDDLDNAARPLGVRFRCKDSGTEILTTRNSFGRVFPQVESNDDLLPPTKTVWYNLYNHGAGIYYDTEAEARRFGTSHDNYIRTLSAEIPSD